MFLELFGKCRLQLSCNVSTILTTIKIFLSVPKGHHVLLKGALVAAAAAAVIKVILSPPALAFTLPVEVGDADIHDRHDAEEDGGAVPLITGCEIVPRSCRVVGGNVGVLDNAGILFDKLIETLSKTINKPF
ncbi:AT-hook motif nuclear-localized protein 28 [Babesia caballi]|uniref:AT-hook motif nuclear-localized protein 28 n=1 Tax=Babesia caballi TaxID=5871 RepID=A0AAV4LUK7_BABCB|nr:AT-hook motif nuclear-localized protein 28 [Babesia caballi]